MIAAVPPRAADTEALDDEVVAAVRAVVSGRPLSTAGLRDPARVADALAARGLGGLAVAEARRRLEEEGEAGLPEAVLEPLTSAYHLTSLHSTLVVESTTRALDALGAAGIPALVFKGVQLLRAGVYPDPGARAVEDGDVLVEPARAEDAVRVLEGAGFVPWEPWRASRMEWLSSFAFSDGRAPDGVEAALDLHWATPYARLRLAAPWPDDPLWEGAAPPDPAPEPHFALMAEHVLKHLRVVAHLRGIADLARLAPRLEDGPLLATQARRRGSLRGLRNLLAFLRAELDVALPAGVAEAVGVPERPSRLLGRRLSMEALTAGTGWERPAGLLTQWMLMGTPWRAAWEVARVALPGRRWLRARYPRGGGAFGRRARYVGDLGRWLAGRGPSPLSPNQGLEG